MQISNLTINGFVGIKELQIDPVAPVTVVCGFNYAGKTSLAQAIGMALRGIPERVLLKKDYGQLVHDGFDEARVAVDMGERKQAIRIRKQTGKAEGLPNPDNIAAVVHAVLDSRYLVNLDTTARRSFLFQLAGTKTNKETVLKLMQEGGANMEKVKQIESLLLAGFDAGEKAAKDYASDARKAWKNTAGEAYGVDKAQKFELQIPAPDTPSKDLKETRAALQADIDREVGNYNQALAASTQRANLTKSIEESNPVEGTRESIQEQKEEANQNLLENEENILHMKEQVNLAKGTSPNVLQCPDCEATLLLQDGELIVYEAPEVDEERLQQQEEELQALEQLGRQIRGDIRQYDELLAALTAQETAKAQLEALEPGEDIDFAATDKAIEVMKAERDKLNEQIDRSVALETQAAQAEKVNQKLQEYHKDNLEWTRIQGLLSPNGVPAVLLDSAMEPFNVCLSEQAKHTGWPQVEITNEMAILYGGRQYSLLSESEQWRTNAMITMTIAWLSNLKFLLLDHGDILDLPSRTALVDWLLAMAEQGVQSMVCMTMKKPVVMEGVDFIWLGDIPSEAA